MIDNLKTMFRTNPSDALYRAENELSFDEFLDFIDWASHPARDTDTEV